MTKRKRRGARRPRYTGYEQLNISAEQVFNEAEYQWRSCMHALGYEIRDLGTMADYERHWELEGPHA